MKKSTIILICVAVVIVLAGAVTGISLAIWQETKSKDVGIDVTPDINPSLRYQIFEPLNESGNLMTDFVAYNSAIHGTLAYDNKTYKRGEPFDSIDPLANPLHDLYSQNEGGVYSSASSAQINAAKTNGSVTLFVRDGFEAYNAENHGYLRYNGITSRGIKLFTKEIIVNPNDGTEMISYNEVNNLRIDDTQELYVRDETADTESYILYEEEKHGTKVPMKTTSKEMVLLQPNATSGEYVLAEDDAIISGEGLWVYKYANYDPNSDADIESYGELRYSYKSAIGQNAYIYANVDGKYLLANHDQLTAGTNLYVSSGKITSYALVGYTGVVAELVVPTTYKGLPVTKICSSKNFADEAFANNPIITTIVIPNSVKSIADGTFANLSALNTIYFKGTGEIRLGDYCFMACSKLKTVATEDISLIDTSNQAVVISGSSDVFMGCDLLNEGN